MSAEGPVALRQRRIGELVFVALFSILTLARLGQDPLSSDEAVTAILAADLVTTGELGRFAGDDLVAYRGGYELAGEQARFIGPLPYLMAAPSVAIAPSSAFWARLPFALCGLALALLVCLWLRRARVSLVGSALLWALLTLSVPLILASREAGFAAPALLASTTMAYFTFAGSGAWRRTLGIALAGWVLLATHHVVYLAVVGALTVDFIVHPPRPRRLPNRWLAVLFASQLAGIVIALLTTLSEVHPPVTADHSSTASSLLTRMGRMIRDLHGYELVPLTLVVAAPLLYLVAGWRDRAFLRAPLALTVFIAVVAVTGDAGPEAGPTRFGVLVVAAPIGILLLWRIGVRLAHRYPMRVAVVLLGVVGLSNAAYLPFIGDPAPGLRSTPVAYLRALTQPREDPYDAAARWLDENAHPRSTVWVAPAAAFAALLHRAPRYRYVGQLPARERHRFPGIEDAHFRGRDRPQYLVAFGNDGNEARARIRDDQRRGIGYEVVATLPVWAQEVTRADPVSRLHRPRQVADPAGDGVVIHRRQRGSLFDAIDRLREEAPTGEQRPIKDRLRHLFDAMRRKKE